MMDMPKPTEMTIRDLLRQAILSKKGWVVEEGKIIRKPY